MGPELPFRSYYGGGEMRPESVYNVQFEERTSYGVRTMTPIAKLFDERIIFVGGTIVGEAADHLMAQLLVLESMDPDREITMYNNSPGSGPNDEYADDIYSLTAVYDTMQYVRPDIRTVCLGQAVSTAAVLLAAGTHGKRLTVPNARVLIRQPRGGSPRREQISDLELRANEVSRTRHLLERVLSLHTGRSAEEVRRDIEREKILTAEGAKEYGMVDEIIQSRKLSAV
jgi:ATP-dependent Clp protease protease subunit